MIIPLFRYDVDVKNLIYSHVKDELADIGIYDEFNLIYDKCYFWLRENRENKNNYKNYRKEITPFILWCYFVKRKCLTKIGHLELLEYIDFKKNAPNEWCNLYPENQFINDDININWKPYIVSNKISHGSLRTTIAIISSFYNFLSMDETILKNPASLVLKSANFKKRNSIDLNKSMSLIEWDYVRTVADDLYLKDKYNHSRTRFIINVLYHCYLRVSEISSDNNNECYMSNIVKINNHEGWYYYVKNGKGNKDRLIPLSNEVLEVFKDYRLNLGLTPLPLPNETYPLIPSLRNSKNGNKGLNQRQIRNIVKNVLDIASNKLKADNFIYESERLENMSVHSFRHTGISHDINHKKRLISHVKADSGHSSLETLSVYTHSFEEDRYYSKNK